MSKTVIKVENLSKKFTISHESNERYSSFRDAIANKAKKIVGKKERLEQSREEFYALRDISFDVQQGDRIGIIGHNGAGKSTLLKILSRITEPSAGRISLRGRVASLLEVGTGFHPELTGRENIFLNGAILGMSRQEIRSKFDEIVSFAEIEKFLDTPVKRYSSGMYVRLAFAVAAHLEPEILIIDEVLAVGDVQFQKKCLGKMEDVSKEHGRTILFVSHNMGVVAQLCQKALLMSHGKIVLQGPTRNVIDQYVLNTQADSNVYVFDEEGSGKRICFRKIETVSADGATTESFQFDESVYIRTTIMVKDFDASAKISVTLQNHFSENLSTFVEELGVFYRNGDECQALIRLPAGIIAPNTYALRLAIFTPNHIYDLVEMICPFTILETGSKMALYQGYNYGSFFLDYEVIR